MGPAAPLFWSTLTANANTVLGSDAADLLTVNAVLQGTNALVFEGSGADGNETVFAITNPTADQTLTFPDATGTVCVSGQTCATSGVVGYWQRAAGVLAPAFITDDLAIGGTATSSALFHVFADTGNFTSSGTASIAGTTTLGYGSGLRPAYGPLTLQYKSGADVWSSGLTIDNTGLSTFTGNVDATSGLDVTTANLTV